MVQQVASVKTESAATSLPFNFGQSAFSGSSDSYEAFSSELMRQTKQVNNQPMQQVANDQVSREANANQSYHRDPYNSRRSSLESQQDYHQKQAELREQQQQGASRHDETQRKASNGPQDHERDNRGYQRSPSDSNPTHDSRAESKDTKYESNNEQPSSQSGVNRVHSDNDDAKVKDVNTSTAAEKNASEEAIQEDSNTDHSTNKVNVTNALDGSDNEPSIAEYDLIDDTTVVKMPAQAKLEGNDNGDDFDYVSFVNQIAQMNNVKEQHTDSNGAANSESLNMEGSELKSQDHSEEAVRINVGGEYSSVLVDKSTLQKILDSKEIQIDLDAQLNDDQLKELRNIISDMLNQMHQSAEDVEQKTLALDEELMLNLLLHDSLDNQNISSDEVKSLSLTEENNSDNPQNLVNVTSVKIEDSESKRLMTSDDPFLTSELKAETTTNVNAQTQQGSEINKADSLKTNAANSPIEGKSNSNLVALAQLNESQTQKALENITSRLQNVVSELNEPNKSNEFIAALQSNVKEFKQQLAQGTETAKDIKNLINDALSSSGIDVTTAKQSKIDGAANQFNAVLNLANNVNYSANLQQSQVLGITDLQYAKELNQQQIDGTKLANATNQANLQANADKAVNIFKQEGQAQLAEKVRWMVNSKNQSAEIRLDPPDLGGVNIKVNMTGDSAQVSFNVQSNAAKEALDQAIPKLRDMLQEQGIELGQSNVQQDNQQQQGRPDDDNASSNSLFGNNNKGGNTLTSENDLVEKPGAVEQRVVNGALGGVDYYA